MLNPLFAVQAKVLAASILRDRPTVVHFAGHGTSDGGLCFETEDGSTQIVAPAALSDLFQLLARTVKCVILNVCNSSIQSQSIARHIDYVIGIDSEIEEVAAIEFAVAFYQGLGCGLALADAHEWACGVMRLSHPASPKPQRVLG